MEIVNLQGGNQAVIEFSHNMWRSNVGGTHYCAQHKLDLLRCISECSSAVIPDIIPEPIRPAADILFDDLKYGGLEQKQRARRTLIQLAGNGDEMAVHYLDFLPTKKLSFQAKYWAKNIGKEFIDVTYADLVEHVSDLVLRNRLMSELSGLFKIEN
jgi:hypothetical protein